MVSALARIVLPCVLAVGSAVAIASAQDGGGGTTTTSTTSGADRIEHQVNRFRLDSPQVAPSPGQPPRDSRTEIWRSDDAYRAVVTDVETGRVFSEWVVVGGRYELYQSQDDTIRVGSVRRDRVKTPGPLRLTGPQGESAEDVRARVASGSLREVARDDAAGTITLEASDRGGRPDGARIDVERMVVEASTYRPLDTRVEGRSPDHDDPSPEHRWPGRDFRQHAWVESYETLDAAEAGEVFRMGPHAGAKVVRVGEAARSAKRRSKARRKSRRTASRAGARSRVTQQRATRGRG